MFEGEKLGNAESGGEDRSRLSAGASGGSLGIGTLARNQCDEANNLKFYHTLVLPNWDLLNC